MAIPTTEESWQQCSVMFEEAMKPIWPNLTRRQTTLVFMAINGLKKDKPIFIGVGRPRGQDWLGSWSSLTGLLPYAKHP